MNPFHQIFKLQHNFRLSDFDTVINTLSCSAYILSPDGIVLDCNEEAAKIACAKTADEMIGTCSYDLLDAYESSFIKNNDKRVLKTEQALVIPERITTTTGKKMLATSFKSPLRSKMSKVIGIIGISFLEEIEENIENKFNLTGRQLECLYYLTQGFSMKEISNKIYLSARTVEHHLEAVKIKLNCQRRSDLIAKALLIPYIKNRLHYDV
jgi:DNA-binding CsgD family transcriptional regulator